MKISELIITLEGLFAWLWFGQPLTTIGDKPSPIVPTTGRGAPIQSSTSNAPEYLYRSVGVFIAY
jgi:hypothetical protein